MLFSIMSFHNFIRFIISKVDKSVAIHNDMYNYVMEKKIMCISQMSKCIQRVYTYVYTPCTHINLSICIVTYIHKEICIYLHTHIGA